MTVPTAPLQEGSRWRYHKPSGEEVAEWFKTVPLDEGMKHEDFVSGVVIIPATEKVRKQVENNGRAATVEAHEMTFTPYVRVDTRVTYFRKLAAQSEQIAVIEPVAVPKIEGGEAANMNLPPGFWWYLAPTTQSFVRYLCCTMRVALYEPDVYYGDTDKRLPAREGVATKQVTTSFGNGGTDPNALAKAETGAVGRALGMAGILVIGTGIATAEDLSESRESSTAVAELPEAAQRPPETAEELAARILNLQGQLAADYPEVWSEIAAWWKERQEAEGWRKLEDAPVEVRRGMATRMEARLEEARGRQDSSSDSQTTAQTTAA